MLMRRSIEQPTYHVSDGYHGGGRYMDPVLYLPRSAKTPTGGRMTAIYQTYD